MIFINCIEAFIFPLFLSYYFDIKNKKSFILISGIIQLIVLNLCSYYNQSGFLLTAFIIVFNIGTLLLYLKHITFEHIMTVVMYNLILLTTSYCGLFFVTFINNAFIPIHEAYHIYIICIIAKILLIIVSIYLIHNKNYFKYQLNIVDWKSALIFQTVLVISTVMSVYSVVIGSYDQTSLLALTIILIILNFYFYKIINGINELNKEKLSYQKRIQEEHFHKEALKTMRNLSNEVNAIDHRLFYVLLQVEGLLKNNETEKSINILEKYVDIITKRHLTVKTNNSVFDTLMSLKINDMLTNDIDIKTVVSISQNDYYNDLTLINFITDILNQLYDCEFVDISIQEISDFLRISIVFDHTKIEVKTLEEFMLSIVSNVKGSFKLIHNNYTEIRIGIELGVYE